MNNRQDISRDRIYWLTLWEIANNTCYCTLPAAHYHIIICHCVISLMFYCRSRTAGAVTYHMFGWIKKMTSMWKSRLLDVWISVTVDVSISDKHISCPTYQIGLRMCLMCTSAVPASCGFLIHKVFHRSKIIEFSNITLSFKILACIRILFVNCWYHKKR